MAKDLEEALVSTKAKLGDTEKPRMDLGAHLEYIESLLERGGGGSGGGSVDLVKPVFRVQKEPVPNTGYLEKFFFDRDLKPEQVDSIIANANLAFLDMGDGMLGYFILGVDSEQEEKQKMLVILDGSAQLGLASGTAWAIADMLQGTFYYVSPALAEAEPSINLEAGWQKAAFASDDANYVTVDADLIGDVPIPVGAQNDLLTELVYVGSAVDSGETELAKSLTGQYKIVEKNIKLDTKENTAYSYDFINSINDDTKEISVIKNIEVDLGQRYEDEIISRDLTTYANDRVRSVGTYAFAWCPHLKAVSFPKATFVDEYAFFQCNELTSVEMPLVDTIGSDAFCFCAFEIATFPNAVSVHGGAFATNRHLTEANLPEIRYIGSKAFDGCNRLKKVFISQTDSVCSLASTDAFTDCYHILGTTDPSYNPAGEANGYIYVPARLLSQYKTAANWSTYAKQIVGHEDLEAGAALPNYATSSFPKQDWYSDEKFTRRVTSVATTGRYYCKIGA